MKVLQEWRGKTGGHWHIRDGYGSWVNVQLIWFHNGKERILTVETPTLEESVSQILKKYEEGNHEPQ